MSGKGQGHMKLYVELITDQPADAVGFRDTKVDADNDESLNGLEGL
jgi:hypothetical protein